MTPQEKEAFARGRLQGLREMDDAREEWEQELEGHLTHEISKPSERFLRIVRLRKEYQKPN